MKKNQLFGINMPKSESRKIFLAMKLTIAFTLLCCFQVFAKDANGQIKLTLKLEKVTLTKVFSEIEKKTNFRFLFNDDIIPTNKKINIEAKDEDLSKVLNKLLINTSLAFSITEHKLIIITTRIPDNGISVAKIIVAGKVTNEKGEPLVGVSVTIKGSSIGTVTGNDGRFTLDVQDGNIVLIFSYIGYNIKEALVANQTNLAITLLSNESKLDDVVVIGYGTQKKRDLTGSVSTVKAEQIRQVPIMSPEQALQGRAAGVLVMQSNGAPGGTAQVQIRGVNSTNAGRNGPLYVLDGVPLFDVINQNTAGVSGAGSPANNTGSPIATLNPNDIETIDVLKDASATAIYGARAANGVVVITTKTGKAGKTKIDFDTYYGQQSLIKKLDMMNAVEGILTRRNALLNTVSDGGFAGRVIPAEFFNPFSLASGSTFKSTDWQDQLFKSAPIMDANIAFSGGTDKFRFLSSTNFFKQDGIFRNTNMQRISTRLNLDATLSPKFKIGTRLTYANQKGNTTEDGNPFQGTVLLALQTEAWNQAFNADGSYFGPLAPNSNFWNNRNPVAEADLNIRPLERNRINANLFAEYEVIPGLKFRSTVGVDYNNISNRRIQNAQPRGPYLVISGPDIPSNTLKSFHLMGNTFNYVFNQTLTYNKSFGNHQLNVLLGFEAQQNKARTVFINADGSLNPNLTLVGANNTQNLAGSESYGETGIVSQFIRANYNYKGKYLISGTVRRDGSSNFGPDQRYGYFPAASIGWRISDENFMKDISFVKDLKLRASHGIVGNQDIGSFAFVPRMTASNYVFGATVVGGFAPGTLANNGLRWEENKKTDVALEFSLFQGRVNIIAEYYINRANGLLVPVQVPSFSGFGSITTNLGTIENKGYEFSVTTENIKGKFNWTTNLNLSTIKNTVLDLGLTASGGAQEFFGYGLFQHSPSSPVNITRAGLPIGSFIGLRTNGIFRSQSEIAGYPSVAGVLPQVGDVKYIDMDKNGVISDNDREILGSPFPDFFGGITNEFSYKNFSLNVFANFTVGNEIYNAGRAATEQFLNGWGTSENLNAWSPSNPTTDNPRLTAGAQSGYNRRPSDRFVEDGSFLRIRNVTFAYNLSASALKALNIQSARFYISGSNLATFTKYKGWDPEVNSSGSNVLSGGIDQIGYPIARTIQLGFNLSF